MQTKFRIVTLALLMMFAAAAGRAQTQAIAPTAQNKALVQNFYRDVFDARNADAAATYLRPDYIQHNPEVPGGLAGFQNFFRERFREAKGEHKITILALVAENDLVVAHVRYQGTGADGKPYDATTFDMYRIEAGKIAEHWDPTEAR